MECTFAAVDPYTFSDDRPVTPLNCMLAMDLGELSNDSDVVRDGYIYGLAVSSFRLLTVTLVIAVTLVARPTQRIIASYQMPIFSMLYPLRSRSLRQCIGPPGSIKALPKDGTGHR
ncbi:MAG: hypothetical protein CM1200mP27_04960 [Chloroflexota bacterium]|nr:MAG: hypothetical protein CM1200mP27_04960 [Chloroflexota bacterium]